MGCANSKATDTVVPPTNADGPITPVPIHSTDPTSKPQGQVPWTQAKVPDAVVTRYEIRSMPRADQVRFANACLKLRENVDGPGTSEWFRLAVIHGGMPPLSERTHPEYCAHRRSCFALWHRPYLNDFERALRRADLALGGDGGVSLPYWDWTEPEVSGEVIPGIVREMLLTPFASGFFPTPPSPLLAPLSLIPTDRTMRNSLIQSGVPDLAHAVLRSTSFVNFSCSAFQTSRSPSVEAPHNSIHGMVGGVMGTFQSAFHPLFWLHHCNVDRILQKYLQLEPDTESELRTIAASFDSTPARGFPSGPYGPYAPFTSPVSGAAYQAVECFAPLEDYGARYDELPPLKPPQLREAPWLASFFKVDVRTMTDPCLVHVFVSSSAAQTSWAPPQAVTAPQAATAAQAVTADEGGTAAEGVTAVLGTAGRDALLEDPSYAGSGAVFFLDSPSGCDNCKVNPCFDLFVDVTAALRSNAILPRNALLHVQVEKSDGTIVPLSQTPLSPPELRGPKLSLLGHDGGLDLSSPAGIANLAPEMEHLQSILSDTGHLPPPEPGAAPPDAAVTLLALRSFQEAAGLNVDGVVGPATRAALFTAAALGDDDEEPGVRLASMSKNGTTRWTLDLDSLPAGLEIGAAVQELKEAFAEWADAAGIGFTYVTKEELEASPAAGDLLTLSFASAPSSGSHAFDGPGGHLAHAAQGAITFDRDERWELGATPHHRRALHSWDDVYFKLKVVALHEIGHALGLRHSPVASDVMSPFYDENQTTLSQNDIERAREAFA